MRDAANRLRGLSHENFEATLLVEEVFWGAFTSENMFQSAYDCLCVMIRQETLRTIRSGDRSPLRVPVESGRCSLFARSLVHSRN